MDQRAFKLGGISTAIKIDVHYLLGAYYNQSDTTQLRYVCHDFLELSGSKIYSRCLPNTYITYIIYMDSQTFLPNIFFFVIRLFTHAQHWSFL